RPPVREPTRDVRRMPSAMRRLNLLATFKLPGGAPYFLDRHQRQPRLGHFASGLLSMLQGAAHVPSRTVLDVCVDCCDGGLWADPPAMLADHLSRVLQRGGLV